MKRSVIILLISIPLFVVLLFVSSIFIATHSQEKNLQEKIGNPIILSGYQDWKEVEIQDRGRLSVLIKPGAKDRGQMMLRILWNVWVF